MVAEELKFRPSFPLMKQTDIQQCYYMKMPRWLFSDPRYVAMSLEAKVAYMFLLNRFQLSRMNGWINTFGEVYVIFPRQELAQELRISVKRVVAAMQLLVQNNLIWERRCGRGMANQIYLAKVIPQEMPDYTCAPFMDTSLPIDTVSSYDLSNQPFLTCQNDNSRVSVSDIPELSYRPSSKKDISKKDPSKKEGSQSSIATSTGIDVYDCGENEEQSSCKLPVEDTTSTKENSPHPNIEGDTHDSEQKQSLRSLFGSFRRLRGVS